LLVSQNYGIWNNSVLDHQWSSLGTQLGLRMRIFIINHFLYSVAAVVNVLGFYQRVKVAVPFTIVLRNANASIG